MSLILYPDCWNAALTTAAESDINLTLLLRRAEHADVGRDYADLVYEMCQLIVRTNGRAAVALGASHDMLKKMKIATGGIDPDTPRFPEVTAVRAALEKPKPHGCVVRLWTHLLMLSRVTGLTYTRIDT